LQDVDTLEELPERMYGVGEAPVREGVGLEQVAELVVNGWPWNWPDRQQRGADDQDKQSQGNTDQGFPASKVCGDELDPSEPPAAGYVRTECNEHTNRQSDGFDGEFQLHSVHCLPSAGSTRPVLNCG
jgi:hypothetical protein